MADRYRQGGHWGVTIVEVGDGKQLPDGRREGDRLIATAQTAEDAELICLALNAVRNPRRVTAVSMGGDGSNGG